MIKKLLRDIKQKKGLFLLIIVIAVVVFAGIVLGIIFNDRKISKPEEKQISNTSSSEDQNVRKLSAPKETEVLSPSTIDLLERTLRELSSIDTDSESNVTDSKEVKERKRSGPIRSEVFIAYDESGNILSLHDVYLGTNLNDGVTFGFTSRNQLGEKTSSKTDIRTRGASNRNQADYDSESNLDTETKFKDSIFPSFDMRDTSIRVIGRFYFDYGSSLDPWHMELSIEEYLLVQKQSEKIKERSSIALLLNDLICTIPEDKKNSAVFKLKGHADSSLFNAVPEISDRSNKFNTALSLKRAESIKAILEGKDFGISKDKIICEGKGYSENENATFDLWKYRRVDIEVSY